MRKTFVWALVAMMAVAGSAFAQTEFADDPTQSGLGHLVMSDPISGAVNLTRNGLIKSGAFAALSESQHAGRRRAGQAGSYRMAGIMFLPTRKWPCASPPRQNAADRPSAAAFGMLTGACNNRGAGEIA